jgi:hypothetical protein
MEQSSSWEGYFQFSGSLYKKIKTFVLRKFKDVMQ